MRVIGGWRPDVGPGRISVWPLLIAAGLSGLLAWGFWRAEFGLTSRAAVLLGLIGLLFLLVQVVASVIVALIGRRWRSALSDLMGIAAGGAILCATLAVPVDLRFAIAARSHYEAEIVLVGNETHQSWSLDAQFLGPDETHLIYDLTDSMAPPYGMQSYREDREGCSVFVDRLSGHFYRQSLIC
jgi:hypothetical protein